MVHPCVLNGLALLGPDRHYVSSLIKLECTGFDYLKPSSIPGYSVWIVLLSRHLLQVILFYPLSRSGIGNTDVFIRVVLNVGQTFADRFVEDW